MSMRNIYREIARKNGVTVEEVKREMQEAINAAYRVTPVDSITREYQDRVPRVGEVPTAEEFIRYAAKEVGRRKK